MDDPHVVEVLWTDAAHREQGNKGDHHGPVECSTVGYLIEETDAYVVLAAELLEGPDCDCDYRGVTTIPRGMIGDVAYLNEPVDDPDPLVFEHTPTEAPYMQVGVDCECTVCALYHKVALQQPLEGPETDMARKYGWLPADPERVN